MVLVLLARIEMLESEISKLRKKPLKNKKKKQHLLVQNSDARNINIIRMHFITSELGIK